MPEMPDATDVELEASRAECAARVADADATVQSRRARVAQLAGDQGRLSGELREAEAQSEAATLTACEEALENRDADKKELARTWHAATGPERLILQTLQHLLYTKLPEARIDQLKALIDLRHAEWKLSELDSQIHESRLVTALAGAVLLEGDLEITGAASRRHAELVSLRAEAHRLAEEELVTFQAQQAKLKTQRAAAGILTK
jgi:hypothetical protein